MKGKRLKDVLDDKLVDKPFWDSMFAKMNTLLVAMETAKGNYDISRELRPYLNRDTQRTRLRHLRMVGSEWLTSIPIHRTLVAQLVEQRPFKADVVGSNPTGSTPLSS